MKIGLALMGMRPAQFDELTCLADELGYESVWMSEHLVMPHDVRGELRPGEEHAPVRPDLPIFDALAYLSYLAGRTQQIKLGTFVYLLALRHPFVGARGFATLDQVSGGRAIAGVGAGWLLSEWEAVGVDPAGRGARLDEAIGICRRLWTEEEIAHEGRFYRFDTVGFEPKPVQRGGPPILIGGESDIALDRAARVGDGWIGMNHDLDTGAAVLARLRAAEERAGRAPGSTPATIMGDARSAEDVQAWANLGVDRLIVAPWDRAAHAEAGIRSFAPLLEVGDRG